MAEVTIKAQQSFGGIRAGEVVAVERTPYIDRLIEGQRVVVVDGAEDTEPVGNDPADGEFDTSTAPTTPPAQAPSADSDDAGEADDDDSEPAGDDGTD